MIIKLEFEIEDPEYWGVKQLLGNCQAQTEFLFRANCSGINFKWEVVNE